MIEHGPRASAASGRALVTAIWVLAGISVGGAAGYYGAPRLSGSHEAKDAASASASVGAKTHQQLYTCGMHPLVLQKEPGECPICHMRLTPLKQDQGEDEGAGDEGNASGKPRKILYWRAPMDPGFISKKPGKSPMGMDLVPVYDDDGGAGSKTAVRIDPVTVQNMGIRTQVVTKGPLARTIRTVGRVAYDEQTVRYVDTKFSGWIETLQVDVTGQAVAKGDPLFSVYSPELFAAQEEYLAALRALPTLERSAYSSAREGARRLVEAAETKLRYLDVPEETIRRLKAAKVPQKTIQLRSPQEGIVTEKMAQEGMYVKPGMRLYTIADLSRIWVYVDIYEYQLPWVRLGQTAKMTLPYIPGREFTGKVIYIYPYLDTRQRVVKVRLEFENPNLELKPGMYATVMLRSELGHDVVIVPREAFIDSGKRKVAFLVRGKGKFLPRDIVTGVETEEGLVEVRAGLEAGDRVVTSGQFLLDAESKRREAVQKMLEAQKTRSAGPKAASAPGSAHEQAPPTAAEAEAAKPVSAVPAGSKYACSMPKHLGQKDPEKQGPYFSKEPGRCPRCGMDLVPIGTLDWVKPLLVKAAASGGASPAASSTGYTCPMHPRQVHEKSPGECPICSMQLVLADTIPKTPAAAPERLQREAGYVLEHYLALWDHLSADKLDEPDVAQHAFGFVKAAKALRQTVKETGFDDGLQEVARDLERAALSFEGNNLQKNRVAFAEVSGAVRKLLKKVRPDRKRWPKLYVFHCPMSKGDWIQTEEEARNPYYGFQHLRCGNLVETR